VVFLISLISKINGRNLGTKEHHANEKEIKQLGGFLHSADDKCRENLTVAVTELGDLSCFFFRFVRSLTRLCTNLLQV